MSEESVDSSDNSGIDDDINSKSNSSNKQIDIIKDIQKLQDIFSYIDKTSNRITNNLNTKQQLIEKDKYINDLELKLEKITLVNNALSPSNKSDKQINLPIESNADISNNNNNKSVKTEYEKKALHSNDNRKSNPINNLSQYNKRDSNDRYNNDSYRRNGNINYSDSISSSLSNSSIEKYSSNGIDNESLALSQYELLNENDKDKLLDKAIKSLQSQNKQLTNKNTLGRDRKMS